MGRTRYRIATGVIPFRELPGSALRACLREGYTLANLRSDVLAGMVVGVVALPLSMALAIAVGVPPQYGLYTAIVAGFLVAALGGSRTQVVGPTAAFVVILAPICARFGIAGLLVSGFLGGLMLVAMGFLRLGRLIEFIPHPVTTGFTAGIGTVIATFQLKDFLGLTLPGNPDHYFERLAAMISARGSASLSELLVGAATLAMLVYLPRWTKRVPAPLVAIPVAALLSLVLSRWVPGFHVATIGTRFHPVVAGHALDGIPQLPPMPLLPWHLPGPGGHPLSLDFQTLRALLPSAFAVAMLGAIESLLSAVVSDAMAQTRHDPDAELLALGVGNLVTPFFGGIAATGAIARTATNIRSGGRSPIASMAHSLTVLAAMLILAPLIAYLPMASLAALLMLVAWNMSDAKLFAHTVRVAPRSDVAVLLTCYGLTVVFDMVVSVTAGIVLAALLFMRRMAEASQTRISEGVHPAFARPLPAGVLVYDISGPLFFGAAERAMGALRATHDRCRVVIFRLDEVPVMDSTGLVALESALDQLKARGCLAVITGLRPQPAAVLKRAQIEARPGVVIAKDVAAALELAEGWGKAPPAALATPAVTS